MDQLAGKKSTGRRIAGPSADLVELESEEHDLYTAILLAERARGVERFDRAVALAGGFLAFPMVAGLTELSEISSIDGAYLYPTGPTRSIAELLKFGRDSKSVLSKRAALELCLLSALVLHEASETGSLQGVYSHGDLSPHRILVQPDGEVQIIGYGMPCPELLGWSPEGKVVPPPETIRYAPPERLTGTGEDIRSDLWSLSLIAAELITGEPLLDGTFEDIAKTVREGRAPRLLAKHKKRLTPPIHSLLTPCLEFDPKNRYGTGAEFHEEVAELLDRVSGGEDLAAAIAPVFAKKTGRSLVSGEGTLHGRRKGRALPGARSRRSAVASDPNAKGRWSTIERGANDSGDDGSTEETPPTSKRTRRSRRGEEADPPMTIPTTEDVAEETRRKLRESTTGSKRSRRSRRTKEATHTPATDGTGTELDPTSPPSADVDETTRVEGGEPPDLTDTPESPQEDAEGNPDASSSDDETTPATEEPRGDETSPPPRRRRRRRQLDD